MPNNNVKVGSEVGRLRRLMIHSPDRGIGRVTPDKASDWLFDDVVHLKIMRWEYDAYVNVLLYFLDPEKIKGRIQTFDYSLIVGLESDAVKLARHKQYREFYKPDQPGYFNSDYVVEVQNLLSQVTSADEKLKYELVVAVCAFEGVSYSVQKSLMRLDSYELAKTLISGFLVSEDALIFAPLPNLIFTRDVGAVLNDYLLLSKPAKEARDREALLARFLFYHHPFFANLSQNNRIIELREDEEALLLGANESKRRAISIEGGDVMLVAPKHLVIGCSERTSPVAIFGLIEAVFERNVVEKVSVVTIPQKRDYMHIDTVFTQVKRDMWVVFGGLSKRAAHKTKTGWRQDLAPDLYNEIDEVKIVRYEKANPQKGFIVDSLEDLLSDVSRVDLGVKGEVSFVYSGGGPENKNDNFPFDEREQWTDGCNVLALREGVIIGYDRNSRTTEAFRHFGFKTLAAVDLLARFENGTLKPDDVKDTLILLPSAELSRARGGSHCMSFPMLRDELPGVNA